MRILQLSIIFAITICPSCSGRSDDRNLLPPWEAWSCCSCGDSGVKIRRRACALFDMSMATTEIASCVGEPCGSDPSVEAPDGIWTSWGEWSVCSSSCGGGQTVRKRECSTGIVEDCVVYSNPYYSYDFNTKTMPFRNDLTLPVMDTDVEECNKFVCPDDNETITNHELCGLDASTRITNGQKANVHQFPWMAHFDVHSSTGTFSCTASILNSQHLLTAAQCVLIKGEDGPKPVDPANFVVYTGSASSTNVVVSRVAAIYVPDDLSTISGGVPRQDIAVLKLQAPLDLGSIHRPVCLPTISTRDTKKQCLIMGWGQTNFVWTDILQYAPVSTIPNAVCATTVNDTGLNYRSHICAGGLGRDICIGDTGGPLMCFDKQTNRYMQHGIASFRYKDACAHTPGIFTDVTKYISWIQHVMTESTVSVE